MEKRGVKQKKMNINLTILHLKHSILKNEPLLAGFRSVSMHKSKISHFSNSPIFLNFKSFFHLSKSSFKNGLSAIYMSTANFIDNRRYYNGKFEEAFSSNNANLEIIFDNVLFQTISTSSNSILTSINSNSFRVSCSNFYQITTLNSIFDITSPQCVFSCTTFQSCSCSYIIKANSQTNFDSKVSSIMENIGDIFDYSLNPVAIAFNMMNITKSTIPNSLTIPEQFPLLIEFSTFKAMKITTLNSPLFIIEKSSNPFLTLRNINFIENTDMDTLFNLLDDYSLFSCVFIKNKRIANAETTPLGYEKYIKLFDCYCDLTQEEAGAVKGDLHQFNIESPSAISNSEITYLYQCPTFTPTVDASPVPTPCTTPLTTPQVTPFRTPDLTPIPTPVRTPEKTTQRPPRTPIRTPSISPTALPTLWPTFSPLATPLPSTPLQTATPVPPTQTPKATPNVIGIVLVSVPSVLIVIFIPLLVFACLRLVREMSSNEGAAKAEYEAFLSEGSSSDSSREDPLELHFTDSDDFATNHEFFSPRMKNTAKYYPKPTNVESRETLIYSFLK